MLPSYLPPKNIDKRPIRLPITAAIENILMKLSTNSDSYSPAGTEAGICN